MFEQRKPAPGSRAEKPWERKPAGKARGEKPWGRKSADGAREDKPWGRKSADGAREDKPWGRKPSGLKKTFGAPPADQEKPWEGANGQQTETGVSGAEPVKEVPYRAGDVVTLTVARVSDLGAFLDAGTGNTSDDILLHKLQQAKPAQVGDQVKVYLYLDPHHRLTASEKLPKMREGQLGYAKVLSVTRDGGFVDIGAERGVFLPYTEMRGHVVPGQTAWVKLYRDKSGRPAVTMRVEEEIQKASKPAQDVKISDMVTGTIYNIVTDGFFIFTKERYIGFMPRSEAPFKRRLNFGEEITCRVTHVREDGRLNISMRPQKEDALLSDAQLLLDTMQARSGKMPYGDETSKEVLREKFGLSKAAFKRALGHLLKEDKVYQEDGWTILKEMPPKLEEQVKTEE